MKEKERINLNSLKYTWTDARDIIELGDKDSRLKITKNGSLKIYINNKEVKINIDKLSGIIGVEPKLFKSGFITFDYDNDKYEPIIISISKKSKKDYEIVRKLLEEAFKSFDIIVGL